MSLQNTLLSAQNPHMLPWRLPFLRSFVSSLLLKTCRLLSWLLRISTQGKIGFFFPGLLPKGTLVLFYHFLGCHNNSIEMKSWYFSDKSLPPCWERERMGWGRNPLRWISRASQMKGGMWNWVHGEGPASVLPHKVTKHSLARDPHQEAFMTPAHLVGRISFQVHSG